MLRHRFTLEKIVEESRVLIGSRLAECFAPEKNFLTFEFEKGGASIFAQYIGETTLASFFLRENYSKPRKNRLALFKSLEGEKLERAEIDAKDRIIRLDFGGKILEIRLFGGAKSNVFLLDEDGKVEKAFKKSKEYEGKILSAPKKSSVSRDDWSEESSILSVLSKRGDLNLGKYYAAEILSRLSIEPNAKIRDLTSLDKEAIESEAEKLVRECRESETAYLLNSGDESIVSLIPLFGWKTLETFSSVSLAVERKVVEELKKRAFAENFKKLANPLLLEKARIERKLKAREKESEAIGRAALYKKWADALSAVLNVKAKGLEFIEIDDLEKGGEKDKIKLDPKKTIIENAATYYKKSRAILEDIERKKFEAPKLEKRLREINETLDRLKEAKNLKELKKAAKTMSERGGKLKDESGGKFRVFDLGGGLAVFVGKSAANNDELTLKFAKPNDYWFHARGFSGSHVILRVKKNEKPPKSAIKQAAAIAAYYSKARKGRNVAVSYALKKYVRKPKGAPPGSVLMSREEVVFVDPRLPDKKDEDGS